jgi:hypothetical protein
MVYDLSVEDTYIAACIDKPVDATDIPGSVVEFDASGVRSISIAGGILTTISPDSNPEAFSWYWTFYPQGVTYNVIEKNDDSGYMFTAEFPVAGDNSATLRVEV